MDVNYPKIIAFVFQQEGGYGNDPRDPGGATNFGITIFDARKYWKADATPADVRAMPKSVAAGIYRDKYWLAMSCQNIISGLDACTMDSGVNSGTGRADKWLAKAMGVPNASYATLATQSQHMTPQEADKAIETYCDTRLSFLHALRTWSAFGTGWGRRVASLRVLAHVLLRTAQGATPSDIKKDLSVKKAEAKVTQTNDVATHTGTTSGQVAAHWYYWQWDIPHFVFLGLGLLLVVYLTRKVMNGKATIDAYDAEITKLEALIK